ncbi:DNA repair protein SWI5 homolog [Babylonia areolata]|uniref:DNA repair protein SWI5 homolog n=1 Tax=Babylonia areolata TaxID=304850 RepID=UPI003FD316C8
MGRTLWQLWHQSWKKQSCVNKEFKSPLISRACGQSVSAGDTSARPSSVQSATKGPAGVDRVDDVERRLRKEVDRLKEELHHTQQHIQQLRDSGLKESELAVFITKLHEYNELKDMGQMVMGNIASVQGVRTRDLYPNYGLELDD